MEVVGLWWPGLVPQGERAETGKRTRKAKTKGAQEQRRDRRQREDPAPVVQVEAAGVRTLLQSLFLAEEAQA